MKSDNPRIDIELKADVTFDVVGASDYAEGTSRSSAARWSRSAAGSSTSSAGAFSSRAAPPKAAVLDIEARYENPAAKVTVTVSGADDASRRSS